MLLTLLSIVIGVASVVSISLSTSAARVAQRTLVKAVSGKASLEIQAEGGAAFDESLQSKLREIPDIELLSPSLRRFSTLMLGENRKARIQVLGIDPKEDSSIREYKIVQAIR